MSLSKEIRNNFSLPKDIMLLKINSVFICTDAILWHEFLTVDWEKT